MEEISDIIKHKRRVHRLIQRHKSNTILNHLKTIFHRDTHFNGIVNKDSFYVWKYSMWSGALYPVIHGNYVIRNGKHYTKIKTRLNIAASSFIFIIILFWAYTIIAQLISLGDASIEYLIRRIIFGLVLFFLPIITFTIVYRKERKRALSDFFRRFSI